MPRIPRTTIPQHRRSSFLPFISVGAILLWAAPAILSQGSPGQLPFAVEFVDGRPAAAGEALVALREPAAAAELRAQGLDVEPSALGIRRVTGEGTTTEALVASLRIRPDVAFAEPNFVAHLDDPNDPYFPSLWGLFNREVPGADINARTAWSLGTGTKAYAVAVVDTGIDYNHPDLVRNVWSAPAPYSVTVRGIRVRCAQGSHGFDAITLTCDPMDDHGHGTRMAGIIGAVGNNGYGVTGVNWDANLIGVKFLGSDGFGTYADAIAGLDYLLQVRAAFPTAADVRILSNSWGGGGFSDALLAHIERTATAGMLFVAAAGNDGQDNDIAPHYPSSFEVPSILAVTATSRYDTREEHASFGATSVDVGAPGPHNVSTTRGNAFQATGGTSTATAFVAGAAALLLSRCGLDARALKATLLATVDPVPDLVGFTATGGRINVGRAMAACAAVNRAPTVRMTRPAPLSYYTQLSTLTIGADALDADGRITSVAFYANTSRGPVFIGADTAAPYRATWSSMEAGGIELYAVARDDRGATATSPRVKVSITPAPTAPPAPWLTADIGSTGTAGSAWMVPHNNSSERFITFVEGAGGDVWGRSDEFRFLYRPLNGDGQITARVAALEHIDPWTKAGVMIRASLSASSPHAFMLVSAGKGLAFQRRRSTGALSVHTSGGPGVAPSLVRLVRSGSTVSAYRSSDGVAWTLVGRDTIPLGSTAYVGVAVVSRDRAQLASAAFDGLYVRQTTLPGGPTPRLLPAPLAWGSLDVGTVSTPGSMQRAGGTITVRGGGADVWGTADAFRFAYHPLSGDGRIIARVAGVQAIDAWTKVGVMMRQSFDSRSPHAFMLVSSAKGLAFQRRLTLGGATTHTSGGTGTAPRWVQLARTGHVIAAYVSADGERWTKVGQSTFTMSRDIWVGLAVSSHHPARLAAGTFTDVSIYD